MAVKNKSDLTVGGAEIYMVDRSSAASDVIAKIGNISVGEISPDNTYVEHFVSVKGSRRQDKTVAVTKGMNVSFTFEELNSTNLDRMLLGSLDVNATGNISVALTKSELKCKGVIDFNTNVGQSWRYIFPNANLRPDGGLPIVSEDWIGVPMVLEIQHHDNYSPPSGFGAAAAAPFGFLHLSNLHASMNATYF